MRRNHVERQHWGAFGRRNPTSYMMSRTSLLRFSPNILNSVRTCSKLSKIKVLTKNTAQLPLVQPSHGQKASHDKQPAFILLFPHSSKHLMQMYKANRLQIILSLQYSQDLLDLCFLRHLQLLLTEVRFSFILKFALAMIPRNGTYSTVPNILISFTC